MSRGKRQREREREREREGGREREETKKQTLNSRGHTDGYQRWVK